MSVLESPQSPPARQPAPGRVVLEDVSWDYYMRTIQEFERSNVRVNYLQGRMEIFMPGVKHERIKTAIARLLETYSTLADVPIEGLGSVTCFRKDMRSGLEPDECYYITTPPPPLTPHALDLAKAHRPDLAVEVDVYSSSVDRESIYAAFGVPEIWRFDGQTVHPNHRQPDGSYQPQPQSRFLPGLSMADFSRFVVLAVNESQFVAAKAFAEWLRSQQKP